MQGHETEEEEAGFLRSFDAFEIDERESSELVQRVVAEAAVGLAGAQFITDQGTPYMAEVAPAGGVHTQERGDEQRRDMSRELRLLK